MEQTEIIQVNTIIEEKEYIILRSIARYGYLAMPQNYAFLSRHSMLNIYFEILNCSSNGLSYKTWEDAVKRHAAKLLVSSRPVDLLKEYRSSHGNKETKVFLDNNIYYWKTFLSEIKK